MWPREALEKPERKAWAKAGDLLQAGEGGERSERQLGILGTGMNVCTAFCQNVRINA